MNSQDKSRKRILLEWLEASRAPSTTGPDTGKPPEVREETSGLEDATSREPKPIVHGSSRTRKPGPHVRLKDGDDDQGDPFGNRDR